MTGAAILALLLGTPQAQAEDDIVIFGGEFEDEAKSPEVKKPDTKPEPKPEVKKPDIKPEPKPEIKKPDVKPVDKPQEILPLEDEDDLGDVLIFDDVSNLPKAEPKPEPAQIDKPAVEPQPEPTPAEVEQPFTAPATEPVVKAMPEPVEVVPPTPIQPKPVLPEVKTEPLPTREERITLPRDERPITQTRPQATPSTPLKTLKQRFVKLAVDDTYTYYLDKTSVQWKRMPYSASEYIADVWIRMVERKPAALDDDMASYGEENFNAEISLAREQGYQYSPDDVKVLSSQAYVLEHYYLRPKTKQVQFLCELEVFGRPQNTINERAYDYKNWESLVPGSVESAIYNATIKIIGTGKASEKGHMTFVDMLDEYARIALN